LVINEPIRIKKKADDGYKVISFRIREDLLAELDKIADETNRSRNEIMTMLLEHGVRNIEVE